MIFSQTWSWFGCDLRPHLLCLWCLSLLLLQGSIASTLRHLMHLSCDFFQCMNQLGLVCCDTDWYGTASVSSETNYTTNTYLELLARWPFLSFKNMNTLILREFRFFFCSNIPDFLNLPLRFIYFNPLCKTVLFYKIFYKSGHRSLKPR